MVKKDLKVETLITLDYQYLIKNIQEYETKSNIGDMSNADNAEANVFDQKRDLEQMIQKYENEILIIDSKNIDN